MLPERDLDDLLAGLVDQIEQLSSRVSELEQMEQVMANNHGWIGGAWQRDPIRDGYSGATSVEVATANAAAGDNDLASGAVPAGEYWRLEHVTAHNANTNPTAITLYYISNSLTMYLEKTLTPGIAARVIWTGQVRLEPGCTVHAFIQGCTLNDDISLRFHYVRVDIDQ